MNRRRFSSVVLPALAAARCSRPEQTPGAQPPAQNTTTPISPSASRVKLMALKFAALCTLGWAVAREEGFFAAEGLDVEFLPAATADTPGHHPFGSHFDWTYGSRALQLLIEAGRMPASASPRELMARVYQRTEA